MASKRAVDVKVTMCFDIISQVHKHFVQPLRQNKQEDEKLENQSIRRKRFHEIPVHFKDSLFTHSLVVLIVTCMTAEIDTLHSNSFKS